MRFVVTSVMKRTSSNLPSSVVFSETEKPRQVEDEIRFFSDDEIKTAFDEFDLDHNSFVGVTEIKHIMKLLGEQVTDDEVDEMIRMCDPDGFGQATIEGFQQVFGRKVVEPPPEAEPSPPEPEPEPVLPPQELIEEQDPDAETKKLTIFQVMEQFKTKQEVKTAYIKNLFRTFRAQDKTKTGRIDYALFLTLLQVDDSPLIRRMFNLIDFDDSGTVEIKDLVITLSNQTSASRIDKLKFAFLMFDDQSNGFVTRDNIDRILTINIGEKQADDTNLRVQEFLKAIGQDPRDEQAKVSFEDFMKIAKNQAALLNPVVNLATLK